MTAPRFSMSPKMKTWWLADAPSVTPSVSSGASLSSTSSNSSVTTSTSNTTSAKRFRVRKRKETVVRFADLITVKPAEGSISLKEAARYWYDRSDLQEMLQNAISVAGQHEDEELSIDASIHPYRGLEWILSDDKKNAAVEQSRKVVFDRQTIIRRHLKEGGRRNEYRATNLRSQMATSYTMHTQEFSMHARLVAMSDKLEADNNYYWNQQFDCHEEQQQENSSKTWRFSVAASVALLVPIVAVYWERMSASSESTPLHH